VSRAAAGRPSNFSIGEVLARLRPDFPDLAVSKIRFLESEGLVEPERTPSGYRKFSHDDIERLRYILTAQRDHYLPLKVIREHLDAIDRGLSPPELPGVTPAVPRVVLAGEQFPQPDAFGRGRDDTGALRLSREELLAAAEVGPELLDQLETYGLVSPVPGDHYYDGDALTIAKIAAEMATYGLEPRHLRTFKTAADRETGLFEQVVAPMLRHRGSEARGRAQEVVRELAALSVRLHATLVKVALHRDGP